MQYLVCHSGNYHMLSSILTFFLCIPRWFGLLQIWMERICFSIWEVSNIFGKLSAFLSGSHKRYCEHGKCRSISTSLKVCVNVCVLQLYEKNMQEFGNIESPMYSRLRHFYATIYSRFVSVIQHYM